MTYIMPYFYFENMNIAKRNSFWEKLLEFIMSLDDQSQVMSGVTKGHTQTFS